MTTLTKPSIENFRRASSAVYLACEAAVADDISNLLKWSADEIEKRSRRVMALETIVKEDLHPDDCSDEMNLAIVEEIHAPEPQCSGPERRTTAMTSKSITKGDYNYLVELFNRRTRADVIGVPHHEHTAIGRALNALEGSWETVALDPARPATVRIEHECRI